MIRQRSCLLAAAIVLAVGCKGRATAGGAPSSLRSVLAAPSASASVAPPLVVGPPKSGARAERERAVLRFFESGEPASVETVAADPGREIDQGLRDALLTHRVPTPTLGKVTLSEVKVMGGAVSDASRVAASMRATLRVCYRRSIDVAPYQGRVQFTLKVGPLGEVLEAKGAATPKSSGAMVDCMVARAKRAQFAPPESGKPATLTFSATLTEK